MKKPESFKETQAAMSAVSSVIAVVLSKRVFICPICEKPFVIEPKGSNERHEREALDSARELLREHMFDTHLDRITESGVIMPAQAQRGLA